MAKSEKRVQNIAVLNLRHKSDPVLATYWNQRIREGAKKRGERERIPTYPVWLKENGLRDTPENEIAFTECLSNLYEVELEPKRRNVVP